MPNDPHAEAPGGLYIRQGDSIQGPFPKARIRELAASGRLKPGMELSADRTAWKRAGDVPGLFAASGEGAGAGPEQDGPAGGGRARAAARPSGRRGWQTVISVLVGLTAAAVSVGRCMGRNVPAGVELAAEYGKREAPLLEQLKPLLAQIDEGNLGVEQRQAITKRVQTELLPGFLELRGLVNSEDGKDPVVAALGRVLDARLDFLRDLVTTLGDGYPAGVPALSEKAEAVRRSLSELWQATPAKYRTPINPHEPFPMPGGLGPLGPR